MSGAKVARVNDANQLIKIISDHGRRFFFNATHNRVSHMILSRQGHIYFVDDYTGKPIYVAYKGRWRGFSHGGTIKSLVEEIAHYIRTGDKISVDWIGPERFDDSNIWGYAEDEMKKCRAAALACPAIKAKQPQMVPA